MSKLRNEFLRGKPARHNRNIVFDLTTLIVPVLILLIGFVVTTQVYAKLLGYNPAYTGAPVYIFKDEFLFFPRGYRLYNPWEAFLVVLANPLDARINGVLFHVYFYLGVFTGVAVLTYFVLAALRTWGLNKNDNLYGTARWATEKDLKRFGLTRRFGVVLGEFQRAKVGYRVNAENSSISLTLKKSAPLACHAGGTNTLLVAPTRSGKGVSSVVPTCLNFPGSMIIFDPKGENYQLTAGFRGKFSHILKFSPLTRETIKFNPLAEIELTDQAFADTGLVLGNMFEEPKGGNDGTSSFFDNNAKDILTGLIIHVLTAVGEDGKRLYPAGKRNMSGVLSILSRAAAERAEGEEGKLAESLMAEMMTARHCDEDMKESETLHSIVRDCASRCKGQNAKVQADVFATVFSKMNLFQDPYIANVTGESDFRLRDFVESELPITPSRVLRHRGASVHAGARVSPTLVVIPKVILPHLYHAS